MEKAFFDYLKNENEYLDSLAEQFMADYPAFSDVLSQLKSDPDAQSLKEHAAFLFAKIHQKMDDAFPEITHNLLERLFALPLRPLPAASILKLSSPSGEITRLKKGTRVVIQNGQFGDFDGENIHELAGENQREKVNENLIFTTARDVTVLPLNVTQVANEQMPEGSVLTLTFHHWGEAENGFIPNHPLVFFLGENTTIAAQLQLYFAQYLTKAEMIADNQAYRIASLSSPDAIFEQNRYVPILPVGVVQYTRLQLAAELISLPHVHDFLTLDFCKENAHIPCSNEGVFQLRFRFNRPLLTDEILSTQHFQLNCVPILNLFEQASQPQPLSGKQHKIALKNDQILYAVTAVKSQRRKDNDDDNTQAESVDYRPISQYLPQHWVDNTQPMYYQIVQTKNVLGQVESTLIFLNAKGEEIAIESDHDFTYHMHCIHSLSAARITQNSQFSSEEDIPNHLQFEVVTPNSASRPPNIDAEYHWQLISHLSLSSAFLGHAEAIRELLMDLDIYERSHYATHNAWLHQVNSLVKTDMQLIDWIFKGQPQRGAQISLYLDPDNFKNSGELYRFGCLIAQTLPFCVAQSAFLKIEMINNQTQETWSLAPIFGAKQDI